MNAVLCALPGRADRSRVAMKWEKEMTIRASLFCSVILGALLAGGIARAQEPQYIGDATCIGCHANFTPVLVEDYLQSGHPYKLVYTGGEEPLPGTWPHSPNPPVSPGL